MSGIGSSKVPTVAAIGTIGAAVLAALSAYLITKASKSKDDDDVNMKLLLTRMEEMQHRLEEMEKKDANNNRASKSKGSKGKGTSRQHPHYQQQRQPQQQPKRHSHDDDADSNANVLPPPLSDEEDDYDSDKNRTRHKKHPPQTIVTKTKEDPTSRFLHRRDNSLRSLRSTSLSHTNESRHRDGATGGGGNANAAYSTTSTLNLREPVPVVLISDPGQDLDDEMMFIMARHLVSLDLISLQGVIANLSPSFARARLTRGTLDLLGLHRVPVGIGTDGGDVAGKHSSDQFETTASSYIIHENGEAARGLESGHRLLQRLYDAAPDIEYVDVPIGEEEEEIDGRIVENGNNYTGDVGENDSIKDGEDRDVHVNKPSSNKQQQPQPNSGTKKVVKGGLTIVITSSMKDIAIFVRDNPTLFASKTREVVVMGGCKPVPIPDSKTALAMASCASDASSTGGSSHYSPMNVWSGLSEVECEPDSAHNNMFDPEASKFFYSQCQKMNIALTVVSRYAAYAAKMPRSVYDDLALTGSSIGWRLRNSQRASIDQLWKRACSSDPAVRKGLPPRCDRKWFIGTFCGGDDDPSRCCADTAWDLVTGFMQYDTIALLAAIPAVREVYFDPFVMPPLCSVKKEESGGNNDVPTLDGLVGQMRIQGGKTLDVSEVTREEDETVTATGSKIRRRSTLDEGDVHNKVQSLNGHDKTGRRNSCPGALKRAIARAKEDNKKVETPFEQPGSNIPEAFDRGTRNLIGLSDKEHNLKDPSLLVHLLKTGYRQGILCNHHTQPHIILHLQLRWDNLADTLLTCLMLRSLWDMRLASVLGVIVSIYPSDSKQGKRPPDDVSASDEESSGEANNNDGKRSSEVTMDSTDEERDTFKSTSDQCPSTLAALAESIRATLCSIGLAHVKFVVVSGKDMDEHKQMSATAFRELYESAPPIGVTLVLTATFTSVWPFAESHQDLFRNKTVRVVHTGGALIWPARWGWAGLPDTDDESGSSDNGKGDGKGDLTDEKILVPDPAAQNHRLDMSSARLFYKRAQALSVPMVILSRHVAKECCIPRNFFDVLGSHGGEVGRRIYDSERNSLLNLYRCCCAPVGSTARGNLPERCDASWFAENFCAGRSAQGEEEVWKSVEAVNLYSPIALLAALPGETLRSYFQTMPFPVRSATHHVIGLTEEVPPRNVTNPSELRSLVVQSLLSAALANESAFGQDPPPMVPIRMDHEQRQRNLRKTSLTNSVISTVSFTGSDAVDEDDMWTFSEAARRELFSRTVAQTSKNAVLPKEKKRKFVVNTENRIAATIGFIPPASQSSDNDQD